MNCSPFVLGASRCAGLLLAIGLELLVGAPSLSAAPDDAPQPAAGSAVAPAPDIDTLISTIQDRPLFTPGRRPPAPPPTVEVQAPPQVKTPPEIRGRLAGITLGPHDQRWAVFARQGERPTVVSEGGEIDGWTVAAIDASQVTLKSEFGEKIMKPTLGQGGEGAPPAVLGARRANPVVQTPPPPAYRPGMPGFPTMGNQPNAANTPGFVRPSPVAGQRPASPAQRRSQR